MIMFIDIFCDLTDLLEVCQEVADLVSFTQFPYYLDAKKGSGQMVGSVGGGCFE